MSAALIELVSRGVQDQYLTGSPEISYFRQNYRKHTNFSSKVERLDYIGTFGADNEVLIPIPSKGDLLGAIWVEHPKIGSIQNDNTGFFSSDSTKPTEFSLWIGGQQVCVMDSLYIQGVHNLLYRPDQAKASCAITTNNVKGNLRGVDVGTSASDHYLIPFFFGEGDYTKCLPLIALQHHAVEIRIKCRNGSFNVTGSPKVYAQFHMLDTDERAYFVEKQHDLLFTEVQTQVAANTDTDYDLSYFNHPVRAFHIVSGNATGNHWSDEWTFEKASLYVNGVVHSDELSNVYHHTIVPELHCSALPDTSLDDVPVYTWPFSLVLNTPSRPTGSINMSRCDTAMIKLQGVSGGNNLHRMYATSWNILTIRDGMAGKKFSS